MAAISFPAYELQTAIAAAVKGDADLIQLCANKTKWLHQDAPPGAVPPYVTLGEVQMLPDTAECIDGSENFLDFHVWAPEFEDCEKIGATLMRAIENATLTMASHDLKLLERDAFRLVRDPDGTTKHGILTIRALTEPL